MHITAPLFIATCCRLLRPANPSGLLINSLLVISQLARSTHAHYDALAGGVCLAWGAVLVCSGMGSSSCMELLAGTSSTAEWQAFLLPLSTLLCCACRSLTCSQPADPVDASAAAARRRQRAGTELQPAGQLVPAQVGRGKEHAACSGLTLCARACCKP